MDWMKPESSALRNFILNELQSHRANQIHRHKVLQKDKKEKEFELIINNNEKKIVRSTSEA